MENNLCEAIKKTYPEHAEAVDLLSAEFSRACFNYGDNLSTSKTRKVPLLEKMRVLIRIRTRLSHLQKKTIVMTGSSKKPTISFQGYFNITGISEALNTKSIVFQDVPWSHTGFSKKIFKKYSCLKKHVETRSVEHLLSLTTISLIRELQILLNKYYGDKRFIGLIIPFDCYFIQRMAIIAARLNAVPSVVYLHGIPGVYSKIDNHQADYLAVWGNAIKKQYENMGIDGNKIIVVGHPKFSGLSNNNILRFSLEHVIVLAHSLPGGLPSDNYDAPRRDGCMSYPWLVELVLKKLGVTSAFFRPHPGENGNWYKKVIDTDFYSIDDSPIETSLNDATLLIGPSSTVWLNAQKAGVHYQVFEPTDEKGKNLIGLQIAPPFDGSDVRLHVAKSTSQLEETLRIKRQTDQSIYNDWAGEKYDMSKIIEKFLK